MSTGRRSFIGKGLGVLALSQSPFVFAQGQPLRIGCITTLSGGAGAFGTSHVAGMKLAARSINAAGGILGRQVEIVVRDDQSSPNTALGHVRELAGDGVKQFVGVLASPVALALSGVMEQLDSIFLNAASHGNNLTHEDFHRNYFRVTDYSAMRIGAASKLMSEKFPGVTKWGSILPDAEIGRSTIATFNFSMPKFYKSPVHIQEPVWVKFGATDFRNAIASLMASDIEGLFIGVAGADEIAFLQQAGQLGLLRKLKVLVNSGSELQVPKALMGRTPENYWSGCHWYYGAYPNNPISQAVYKEAVAQTKDEFPEGFIGMGHTAVMAIAEAAKKSRDLGTSQMIQALEGLTFDTVKGPMTLRKEDHQSICDVNYVNPVPDGSPHGWSVKGIYKVSGAEFAGPPTPGKKIVFA